jgi:rubrerythrin
LKSVIYAFVKSTHIKGNPVKNEACIEVCNKLLKGELSAIETYDQALEKFKDEPSRAELLLIKSEHSKSVNLLRENIKKMGGMPSEDSGAWGTFAKIVEGSAKLFGENAALSALKQGEQYGESLYKEALVNEKVMSECKFMIKENLLPRQVENISQIETLIENN